MKQEIADKIAKAGILGMLIIDKPEHAVPVARALLKGGVNTLEIPLRTPAAMEAARIIKKELPGIVVGVGTILTVDQVKQVADIGADFAVSPGCNPKIIKAAGNVGMPFSPGIATPTDIETAIENGCRILKYFPAATMGGMKHLESMGAPYFHLNLKYIPLGGVNMTNAESYLRSDLIIAIGGSWIAKRELINAGNWDQITQNAEEAVSLFKKIKSEKL